MKEFGRLVRLMKRLRSPINGCPWDRKQTPESLSTHIIEEANELSQAIRSGSVRSQLEELGDLLLQVVFLSQIHQERGNFSLRDVILHLRSKLIRRHPHIFSNETASSAEEVKQVWERVKQNEAHHDSVISDYPVSMPALSIACRVGEQAASVGFDWTRLAGISNTPDPGATASLIALEKLEEEAGELRTAIGSGDRDSVTEELGDLLFSLANVARLLNIDAEAALHEANGKFKNRFRFIESRLKSAGKSPSEVSLDEMEALWQEAKTSPSLLKSVKKDAPIDD